MANSKDQKNVSLTDLIVIILIWLLWSPAIYCSLSVRSITSIIIFWFCKFPSKPFLVCWEMSSSWATSPFILLIFILEYTLQAECLFVDSRQWWGKKKYHIELILKQIFFTLWIEIKEYLIINGILWLTVEVFFFFFCFLNRT